MYILGISAYYHDSAACLLKDGEILAAAQEERFTRKKHDHSFPKNAIHYCLHEASISETDINYIAFYDKPFVKFERILETYLAYAPLGLRSFIKAMPLWIRQKLWIPDLIEKELGCKCRVLFPEHHESHAASAFFPSPFERAAFLTIDGVGEWATSSFGIGKDNRIEIMAELRFPHSLGLLYSAFTYFTGFKVNSGEYKVMGLAPYGEPKYVKTILDHLIDLKEDGSFKMNMEYFNYCSGLTMTNKSFEELFEGPPRKPESRLTQREMDIARSIQEITEEIMLRMARHIKNETGEKYLCLAGGVALNCVGNGKILRSGLFDDIWIQPAAGVSGWRCIPDYCAVDGIPSFRAECNELSVAKPNNQLRIFIFGGSTVAGSGVEKGAQTISGQLEILINKKNLFPNRDVRVINAGVGGFFSFQEVVRFIDTVLKYQPDMVIFFNGHNDYRYWQRDIGPPNFHFYDNQLINGFNNIQDLGGAISHAFRK